tara:strand:- start:773 stop:1396 length:624 start_codon:yes stop_codon:yes gene_type:complete
MTLTSQQFRKLLTNAIEERKAHDRATRKANLLKEGYTPYNESSTAPRWVKEELMNIIRAIRKEGGDPSLAVHAWDTHDETAPENQMLAQIINRLSNVERENIRLGDVTDVKEFIINVINDDENIFYDDVSEVYNAKSESADRIRDRWRDDRGLPDSTVQFEKISAQGYVDGIRGNQIDPRYAKNGDYMIAYNAGQERLAAREEVATE